MLSTDVGEVLKSYFSWSTQNNPADLYYPHIEMVRRLLGGGIGCEGLSDDEALLVNFALARLKQDNPEAFRVIHRIYADQKTIRWMETHGEGSRITIGRLASEGREFVRGVIFGAAFHEDKKSGLATV